MNRKVLGVSRVVFVAAALIGLSACGGGGGSSGLMSEVPGGNMPPTDMQGGGGEVDGVPMQLTETQLYGDIDAYGEVAANSPNFGSITQSSNGNGISTDRVETTLEAGGELTVVVRDGNGGVSLELDSLADLTENLNGTAWMDDGAEDFPSNWSGNGWVLSKQDGNDTVVAVAYTAWEDTDDTNYLAGGYWVKVNANDDVTEMPCTRTRRGCRLHGVGRHRARSATPVRVPSSATTMVRIPRGRDRLPVRLPIEARPKAHMSGLVVTVAFGGAC